jgi:hypothetical protein
MKKRGNILAENIIFIILNLAFIGIIILFISLKTGDAAVLEEVYAKQIAMMIDAAQPGMIISLDMKEGIDKARKELGTDKIGEIVKINKNIVTVQLREGKTGYSYSFFNNVDVSSYLNKDNNDEFIFVVKAFEKPAGFDILKIINYAKDNVVTNRQCNCGEECENYANFVSQSSNENGIEPVLLLSLMMQESACTKDAVSGSSVGLMQINLANCGNYGLPANEEECKTELLNNPQLNIETGAKILLEKYNAYRAGKLFTGCTTEPKTYYEWEAALRGYNGWGCDESFPGQDSFVEEVVQRYNALKEVK